MVLNGPPLIARDVKHISMGLLAIGTSSLVNCLFISLSHILIGLFDALVHRVLFVCSL